MAMVSVENLGRFGIVLDVPPHELPPEAFSGGENIRFFEGKVMKMRGDVNVFGTPAIAPHALLYWNTGVEDRWIYAGTNEVYYTYNTLHTNITRFTTDTGDNDYDAGIRPLWTGGNLHGVPVINNNNDVDPPQQWDESLGRLKDLENWPAATWVNVLRPFQNFLIGLRVKKGANEFPYIVKWSHPADPGTVPISWDETDPTRLAGEKTIAQSGGPLVDCLPLAGQNILYKTDSIWGMSLSGSQFVFNFRELSSTIGALAPRCIAEFFRQHFVVGQNDIVLFDGNQPKSIVNNRVRNWFFDTLHALHWDKTFVQIHYAQREIWVCFVEAGATSQYCTRALVWNWDTNTWSTRVLPDIAHLGFGVVSSGTVETFDNSVGTSFDMDFGIFNTAGVSPTALQLLMAKAYSIPRLLHGDEGYTANGAVYRSYIERVGLALVGTDRQGNPKVDPLSVKFIRSFIPKITAPLGTTLQISIGMQDDLNGPIRWEGPQDFIVGTTAKIDVGLSGRYIAYKIEDVGASPWAFTGFKFDLDLISEQ